MTALDLRPSPSARPLRHLVLAHAAIETRLLARNGEQLVLAVVIPLLVLVGGARSAGVLDLGDGRRIDIVTPGVLALAVMSTAFTSLAIATGFERRYGVLKWLGASPLPRSGLLAAKVLSLLVIEGAQLALIGGVALALGWEPTGGLAGLAAALLLVGLGTAAFASWALLLAGTLRAEATLALANLVYVVLLVAGAVVIPLDRYPDTLQPLVAALPSGALAEGLRQAANGGGLDLAAVAALAGWAVVGAAITARRFRWE